MGLPAFGIKPTTGFSCAAAVNVATAPQSATRVSVLLLSFICRLLSLPFHLVMSRNILIFLVADGDHHTAVCRYRGLHSRLVDSLFLAQLSLLSVRFVKVVAYVHRYLFRGHRNTES